MNEPQDIDEPLDQCARCKFYFAATPCTRISPGDDAECGHPKFGHLLTFNMRRGIIKRCSHFEPKWFDAVKLRDIDNLPKDYTWTQWFTREAELPPFVAAPVPNSPQEMGWVGSDGHP